MGGRRRNISGITGMYLMGGMLMLMLRIIHYMRRIVVRVVPLRAARRGLRRCLEVCNMRLYDFLFP